MPKIKTRPLVFVTVVPKAMMYSQGGFHEIDIKKANRWLKDTMKKVGNRTMLGSGGRPGAVENTSRFTGTWRCGPAARRS
jgi:hypothetical protein